MQGSI